MNLENVDSHSAEYQRYIVDKFSRDLVERKIYFEPTDEMVNPPSVRKSYAEMAEAVRKYFDSAIQGEERVKLEDVMFKNIVSFATADLIRERIENVSILEQEIQQLSKKNSAIEKLLVNIMTILAEMSKKIDKLSS